MNPGTTTVSGSGFDGPRACAAGYSLRGDEGEWLAHIAQEFGLAVGPAREVTADIVATTLGDATTHGWRAPRPGAAGWVLRASDGLGRALVLTAGGPDPSRSPRARRGWDLVARHLAAALRIRTATLAERTHAPGDALRARLAALGPLAPLDAVRAHAAWDALASGALSLLDRVETPAHRFLVLRPAAPTHPDPRALTARERDVLTRALRGDANKLISYDLGVSQPTVSGHLARALRKLGATCLLDLAGCFSPAGLGHAELGFAGETLRVLALPAPRPDERALLTPAEREVAADVLSGLTNLEIARRRNRSERTVANQVVSVFRKFGINSRRELAVHLIAS